MSEPLNVEVVLDNTDIVIETEITNQAAILKKVIHDNTLLGDGLEFPLGVNTDIVAIKDEIPTKNSQLENDSDFVNSEYVTQGLEGKQDKGDYATNTRVNQVAASIPEAYDDTEIRGLIDEVEETSEQAKAIAEGKATGYVFDTVDDMNTWLETNSNILKLGDNLYIRAVNVPDYWWDGETAQQLETQKVDLSSYVKKTDYATNSVGGVIKSYSQNAFSVSNGFPVCSTKTLDFYNSKTDGNMFIGRGTLENIKNDLVKRAVTENDIELTDDEKTSARTWIGAVSNTDYAGIDGSAGLIKTSSAYGTQMVTTGYIRAGVDTLESYNKRGVNFFIGKGTLENIKDDYVKRGLTENTLELTDDEKASARTWLGTVGNTDYAGNNKVGLISAQYGYGLSVTSSGHLYCNVRTLEDYNGSLLNSVFISKGTLNNVLTQYAKTVLTTEADYNALETKDSNTLYLIEE